MGGSAVALPPIGEKALPMFGDHRRFKSMRAIVDESDQ